MLSAIVMQAASYNIWVAGVQVTDGNKGNITGSGISGTVSYDSSTKTLTLDGATISYNNTAIKNESTNGNITIKLVGTNSVSASTGNAIYSGAGLIIENSGSSATLKLETADGKSTIEVTTDLEINGITLETTSEKWAVKAKKLTMNKAYLKATIGGKPYSNGAIDGVSTIVLKGNSIIRSNCTAIYSFSEPIDIMVDGNVSIYGTDGYAIYNGTAKTTISSRNNSILRVTQGGDANYGAIMSNNIEFSGIRMDVTGKKYGISLMGKSSIATVKNSIVKATASSGNPAFKYTNFEFDPYCCIYDKKLYNYTQMAVCNSDGTITSSATVGRALYVNNTFVSATNKNDILGDGKVKFNPDTRRFTFNYATFDHLTNYGFDAIEVEFVGNNSSSGKWDLRGNTTLMGSGSLSVVTDDVDAIDVSSSVLTFESGNYRIVSDDKSALYGKGTSTLVFNAGASVEANGPMGAIYNWKYITLNDVEIVEPKGAKIAISGTYKAVVDNNGDLVTGSVYIKSTVVKGDVNLDGKVNVDDVNTLSDKLLGKSVSKFNNKAADMDNNGEISIVDAAQLVEYLKTYHDYVDLGLSVKWATCNIGASKPEEGGLYFAWGDTKGYTSDTSDGHSFNWSTAPFNGGNSSYSPSAWEDAKSSAVDSNNNLLPANDAATVNWGGTWRMPTYDEQTELRKNCYWEWTNSYNNTDVKGYIVSLVYCRNDICVNLNLN